MKSKLSLLLLATVALIPLASHAQTAYTLGTYPSSPQILSADGVPIVGTSNTVWINVNPIANPTSSHWIAGIPLLGSDLAVVNYPDPSYQVTYASSVSYTAPDGRTFIADIPAGQQPPSCTPNLRVCHTNQLPSEVQGTFFQANTTNPLTGVFAVAIGDYHYTDQCSGRGCGGSLGWHVSVTGGQIVVNAPQQSAKVETPHIERASFHLKTRPLFKDLIMCCSYPPGYSNCDGEQMVTNWWQCGPPGVNCAVFKGYCEVSGEGGYYAWVYWTWYT